MRNPAYFFYLCLSILALAGCGPNRDERCARSNDNEMIRLAPDQRVGAVFFFKAAVSTNEQTRFLDEVLSVRMPGNRGHWPLPGMQSTLGVRVHNYDGFAIAFACDATEDQKAEVIRRLNESPLIYRVYQNAVPNDINDL